MRYSPETGPQKAFGRSRFYSALFLSLLTIFAFYIILFCPKILLKGVPNFNLMALFLFLKQDVLVLPIFFIGFMFKPNTRLVNRRLVTYQNFYFFLALIIIFCLCWFGQDVVFLNYDLSRDTQMANFDADIYAHLRLFAPIPLKWRHIADALNQVYILPIGNHEDWVSFYLPVNAALRAIFGIFLDRSLTSPTLVIVGAVALWRSAKQLFPDSPSSQWIALALYAGSSQVIITGMTAYAMTGHLALNLVWLTLFLERKPRFDAGAIIIGFLATGLHQPVFHPLFVLPFLDLLRQERNWRRLAIYGIAYLAISEFWIFWPNWISSFGTEPVPLSANPNGIGVFARLSHMIAVPQARAVWIMCLNLLRFVVWQHLLLIPLFLFGITCGWKTDPTVRALTLGILLTATTMFILMPYQGHGWGYRYLHGLIGSTCLLATYGVRSLESQGYSFARPLLIGTLISIFILLPAHAFLAKKMVLPFASANEAVNIEKVDVVVIDDAYVPFGLDLVLNNPNLSNKPIRLMGSQLTPQNIDDLCQHYTLSFFDDRNMNGIASLFDLPRNGAPTTHQLILEKRASDIGCRTERY